MSHNFKDRVVVVTGAAIGFGRAISQAFVAGGARVYGCDIRQDELNTLHEQLGVLATRVDLTDRAAAAAWIAQVEADAGQAVDVLVNNAGGVAGQSNVPIEEVSDAAWDAVIEINLGAAMALSRACARGMKTKGAGAIVNVASGAALKASLTGVQAYCAAKHGLLGLTRQLAQELGPFGVRVNAVAPGFVRTNAATERQWAGYSQERQAAIIDAIALRRLGRAEDIANAVAFLASDEASFISGEILSVNGGSR
ncbi:SDR family NAD(P)-dependent oxidoreductase [Caulobacter segnis]|uniref:SDR family NAD(P)-dependent oxidoreductase n=1 Tax=Caulobacter segnis TaxID=88688 RepID=UPI00240F2F4E|nr:SDR family NAD(P)-dependent oxidoreductase [Caulobacter segnis]MDG2522918.1 SDR family NAD(P)-dependent oxidoreductase [Caulobacter segnis]